MQNYHKIISFALGLLYMLALQFFSQPQPVFRFLLPAFFALVTLTFFYNRWYLKSLNKYNFWIIIRPVLLEASGFLLYLLLLNSFFRGLFLVVTVFLITLFEILLANFSENLLMNEVLVVAFGFCFAFSGFLWYAPDFSYLYVFALFISLFFLARCFYEFVPQPDWAKLLNALVVSFFSSQIFWATGFLPFHYSALSILLLNFFYLTLVLNYFHLFHTLTPQKWKYYFSVAGISLLLVFGATPWAIVN